MNKLEKKREHYSQTLNVEQKTFTPFVFSATGEMRRECPMHVKKLSHLISTKQIEELSRVTYVSGIKLVMLYQEVAYSTQEGAEG